MRQHSSKRRQHTHRKTTNSPRTRKELKQCCAGIVEAALELRCSCVGAALEQSPSNAAIHPRPTGGAAAGPFNRRGTRGGACVLRAGPSAPALFHIAPQRPPISKGGARMRGSAGHTAPRSPRTAPPQAMVDHSRPASRRPCIGTTLERALEQCWSSVGKALEQLLPKRPIPPPPPNH